MGAASTPRHAAWRRRPLLVWAGVVLLAGGAAAAGSASRQGAGAGDPQRAHPAILSLNPCTDAILAEVADRRQIVALSAYSRDPAQSSMDLSLARSLPATSGSLEEVVALRPDVLVSGSMTPPATRAALARLGIRLFELGSPRSVPESEGQIRALAALAGQRARGEALVQRIERALDAAAPSQRDRPTAIVWQSGGMVAGPDTLVADLLRRTGFADFAGARGFGQAQILPLETMLADPPRVILAAGPTTDRSRSANEDRLLAHPALAALRGTARVAFDPRLEWCGGPTIIRAVRALAAIRRGLEQGGGA